MCRRRNIEKVKSEKWKAYISVENGEWRVELWMKFRRAEFLQLKNNTLHFMLDVRFLVLLQKSIALFINP